VIKFKQGVKYYDLRSINSLFLFGIRRWAGDVARMGKREMNIGFWWENQKDRGH
jgi:hypothetical protein